MTQIPCRENRNVRLGAPLPKPVATAVAFALLALNAPGIRNAAAAPTGGQVTAGAATISQTGANTVINQSTPRAALNWQSFSIGAAESVVFQQPSSSAVALNRVVGPNPSAIHGTLQANGHVFLINPSGVLFGKGANVDVAGLVASTLNITNSDFMAGRYVFSGGAGSGAVVNHGNIRATKGGYVAFLGNQVTNTGTIVAANGSVAFGAGDTMLLDFNGDGLLNLRVNAAAANAGIDHGGLILADGGRVIMSAQAKNALLSTVLNVDGFVFARSIAERNGEIFLEGGREGVTRIAGLLDASSSVAGLKGGEIRVLGEYVGLFDNAALNASGAGGGGTVLVGGDFQGKNPDIQNALVTYVGPEVTIKADAITAGNGGKVIVWADDATRFYGNISARGGAQAGDGGFVEVSGKRHLTFRGRVDTSAPQGETGTLLLDPAIITLMGGTGDGDDAGALPSNFAGTGGGTPGGPGATALDDTAPTTLFESEIEAQSEVTNIVLLARNSILINGTAFTNASGNPGDGAGVLALAGGRSLTLETRNNGAGETGGIDLVTGGSHGANLRIRTSGAGAITIRSGVGGNQATPITLPQLEASTGGVTVRALQGGAVNITSISTSRAFSAGGPVAVRSESAAPGVVAITGAITTSGAMNIGGAGFGGANVIVEGASVAVGAVTTSGGNSVAEGAGAGGGNAGSIMLDATGAPPTIALNGNLAAIGGNASGAGANDGGTGGAISVLDAAGLGAAVGVNASGGAGSGTGSVGASANITFSGAVNGAFGLTTTTSATTTFGGAVGGTAPPLTTLTVSAGGTTAINGGAITTTGNQTFGNPVTLGAPTTLNAGVGTIAFNSTLAAGANALTLTANGIDFSAVANSVTGTGAITLQPSAAGVSIGIAGGAGTLNVSTTDLAALANGFSSITIGRADGAGTTTVNAVTFADPVTIRQPSAGGLIVVNGAITGTGNASVTLDGPGATTLLNAGITTANQDITISDSVLIGNGLNITLSTQSVVGGGNIAIAGATNGTPGEGGSETLTLNAGTGTVNLGGLFGAAGAANAAGLTAVTVTNAGATNFNGPIAITGALTQTNAATGVTTFADTVSVGSATLRGTAFNLNNSFASAGATAFTNSGTLTKNATGAITSTGAFSTTGAVNLASNITTTNSNLTVGGSLVIAAGAAPILSTGAGSAGNVTFGGTVNGGLGLTVNSGGTTTFTAPVGGATALGSLTTDAPGTTAINGGAITTTGNQLFGDPVAIGANTTLASTAGNVTFAGALNADLAASNRTLAVNAPTGTVTFSGNVGNTQALADLDVAAGPNTIVFNGAAAQTINVTAQGGNTLTFTGPTLLLQNLTLNTNGATANNVTFVDSINAGGVGSRTFTLNAGTGAVIVGLVGNTAPLGTLNMTGNTVTFNAGATAAQVAITANQVLGDPANGVIFATAPFAGFGGPAALTLSGLTTDGTFGTLGTALRVDVPGLLIVAPNASSNSSIVYLRGDPAKKPFYEFYDVATRRLVCYNGCPFVAGANPARPYDDFRLPEDPPDELGTLPPIAGRAGPAVTCVAVRTSETDTDLVCDSRSR